MARYYGYGFPEYVPVAKKRAQAEKKLKALKKKNPHIQPVTIEGKALARTWWGKSWNQNLERYADYSNRIGRGRSYVRNGAVLDLRIESGKIHALVQGSQASPYKVTISIKALNKNNWKCVRDAARGQLDSLAELLAGKFPKSLQEVFFAREEGLFPSPKEIDFDCSCPDWAYMCKHVAAALYGVGARLDEDPGLFFNLRQIKMDDLISQAVQSTSRALLEKAETRSGRVLEDSNLSDVFGIKLDEEVKLKSAGSRGKRTSGTSKRSKTAAGSSKKTTARKPGKPAKRKKAPAKSTAKSATKSTARRKSPLKKAAAGTLVDRVVSAVAKGEQPIRVADICARVDLDKIQVRNALTRAVAQGSLKTAGRGAYVRP